MSKASDQKTGADASGGTAISDVYARMGDKVTAAYGAARDKAGEAVEGVGTNPLAAVLGGLAIGAIAGALLPRLEKEKELLAPLGERVGDAARAAIDAGKSAGISALDDAGLSTDALRGQVSKLVEQAISAAGAAGSAAVSAAREAAAK